MKPTRAQRLAQMREAGYHNDNLVFTRAFIGSRIALQIAQAEFAHGQNLRHRGVPCTCTACTQVAA